MDDLVTIGRFSKMTRLSVKALRIYDDTGLLRPAWVDPASGYRYYRRGQANRAEAIRILRSVEMPLDEIREALAHEEPAVAQKVLGAHRDRLAQRLADQERMLRFLERLIERKGTVMPYSVTVTDVPVQHVVATRRTTDLAHVGAAIESGFTALMGYLGPRGIAPAGAPMAIYHDVIDTDVEGTIELCLPVPSPVDGADDVHGVELPAGPVATTVHQGPYDQLRPAYHTLEGWIAEHGYEIAGPPREVYVDDPTQVPPDDLRTQIDWPVRRATDDA